MRAPACYDLAGPEAARTGEWREGIGGSSPRSIGAQARELLAPYLDAVAAFNGGGELKSIPARPRSCAHWLRPQDRLIACELEPNAAAALARHLRGDRRVKAVAIDGWTALNAYVPPQGAARPGADRSAVRGAGRVRAPWPGARSRAPQMGRPASMCSGIRSRTRARPDALARRLRRLGIAKDPARRTHAGRHARRRAAARHAG